MRRVLLAALSGLTLASLAHAAPSGDGDAVRLSGPVMFRMFWRNTERLLTNALIYGPALD